MATIDIVFIAIMVWGAFRGWRNGLLKEVVSTLGFFLGLFIAYHLYASCGDFLSPHITQNATIGKILGRIIAFILLWVVSPIVIGLIATMFTKTLKGIHLGFINSFTGTLVGMLKYVILLSFVFGAMNLLGILDKEKREQSIFFEPVASVAGVLLEHSDWKRDSEIREQDNAEEAADTVWIPIHHKNEK